MSYEKKRGTNDVGKGEVVEVRVHVLHVWSSQRTQSVKVIKVS